MTHANADLPPLPRRRPARLLPRCPRCAGRLRRCQGELYCPDCLSWGPVPEPAPAADKAPPAGKEVGE
jgi:hypothetical protein